MTSLSRELRALILQARPNWRDLLRVNRQCVTLRRIGKVEWSGELGDWTLEQHAADFVDDLDKLVALSLRDRNIPASEQDRTP